MTLPATGAGPAVAALLTQLRTRRLTVRANKVANAAASLPSLRARVVELERLTLALTGLVAQLIDPAPGDLTDDGA